MSSFASRRIEPSETAVPDDVSGRRRAAIEEHEPRNILVMAGYQMVVRIAWVFKTETVIMPAVIDVISGAGWVRGFLPVLNRVGQSVPPLFFAERLRNSRLKRTSMFLTAVLMATVFAVLSVLWLVVDDKRQPWMAAAFLLLYALFFGFTGLNQLAIGTVQGKLIRAHRRGRIMTLGGIVGSLASIAAAAILLTRWLAIPDYHGYVLIFAFTSAGFAVAAMIVWGLYEPEDTSVRTPTRTPRHHFSSAWQVYTRDRSFRRAANVGMLFILGIMLFPHYRWLASEQLGTSDVDMVSWVIAQNLGVGVFSPLAGMMADAYGNRLVMRYEILLASLTPLLALFLASPLIENGARFYWIVFVCLGLIPVTVMTVFNYTLELAKENDHPRYLSTMRICLAVPFVISPLAGLLLDLFTDGSRLTGVCLLFGSVSLLMAIGGLLTFRMEEPRHRPVDASELPTVRG